MYPEKKAIDKQHESNLQLKFTNIFFLIIHSICRITQGISAQGFY